MGFCLFCPGVSKASSGHRLSHPMIKPSYCSAWICWANSRWIDGLTNTSPALYIAFERADFTFVHSNYSRLWSVGRPACYFALSTLQHYSSSASNSSRYELYRDLTAPAGPLLIELTSTCERNKKNEGEMKVVVVFLFLFCLKMSTCYLTEFIHHLVHSIPGLAVSFLPSFFPFEFPRHTSTIFSVLLFNSIVSDCQAL